jgi:hypothetical protein
MSMALNCLVWDPSVSLGVVLGQPVHTRVEVPGSNWSAEHIVIQYAGFGVAYAYKTRIAYITRIIRMIRSPIRTAASNPVSPP